MAERWRARRRSTGSRCSGLGVGLRPTKSSTKGQEEVLKLTGARVRAGRLCRGVGVVDRWRRCRASPGLLIHQEGSQRCCEQGTGVRGTQGSPVASNCLGTEFTCSNGSVEISAYGVEQRVEEVVGEVLSVEAELARAFAWVTVQRGG